MESTGASYYTVNWAASVGASTKLSKVNAITGAWVSDVLTATNITDIKFDGERYIYIGTTTGLRRLDIRTDTVSSEIAITNGVQCMAINGKHVTTFPISQSGSWTVTRVLRSTFAIDTTVTPSGFIAASLVKDAVVDFDGNVLGVSASSTAGDIRIVKVTTSGTLSYLSPGFSGASSYMNAALQVLDASTILVVGSVSGSTRYQALFNPDSMSLTQTAQSISGVYTVVNITGLRETVVKLGGSVLMLGRGTNATAVSGTSVIPLAATGRMSYSSGNTTNDTPLSANTATAPFVYSDGARIFTPTTSGLKVYTNLNSNTPYSAMPCGQWLIPA